MLGAGGSYRKGSLQKRDYGNDGQRERIGILSVARRVDMSERTVRRRTPAICDRLDVPAPIGAVVWAVRHGLL